MEENLSCEETNDSLIIDEDGEEIEIDHTHHRIFNKVDNFNINESIPMMGHESFREMLERETDFLPTTHYLNRLRSDLSFLVIRRNQSLDWILKVCVHYKFGPLCIYLSMNYFDRFLTSYDLPRDKAWAFQLLSVSCLSLASKLEETDLPQQTIDLQVGDPSFVFEAKTIKRMELLVLNTLNWRLHSLTPFSFIDFYIEKISSNGRVSEFSIYRSSQFILNTIKEIEFLEFRPSEIAAAAALYVSGEGKFIDDENTMFDIAYVKKENVKRCLDLMRNLTGDNTLLSPRLVAARAVGPVSPIGVLEATCLSYKSEETSVESCTNSSESSEDNNINISNKKRRKL